MVLKLIYSWVAWVLALPFILWNAIVAVLMWDSKYFDNAAFGVSQGITGENGDDNGNNTIIIDKFTKPKGLDPKNRF